MQSNSFLQLPCSSVVLPCSSLPSSSMLVLRFIKQPIFFDFNLPECSLLAGICYKQKHSAGWWERPQVSVCLGLVPSVHEPGPAAVPQPAVHRQEHTQRAQRGPADLQALQGTWGGSEGLCCASRCAHTQGSCGGGCRCPWSSSRSLHCLGFPA